MEENKSKATPQKEVKKLSYEQLEEVSRQMSVQLDSIFKENQQLKAVLQKQQLENLFAELNFRFKVLEHSKFFDSEFVEKIVLEIQEIMTLKEDKEEMGNE